MFFGYPIAATGENWLHECLCQMVTTIHASLDAGAEPPPWPKIIPEARRDELDSRRGLRDRLARYSVAAGALTARERAQVLTCLEEQNEIANLVSNATACDRLDGLPEPIQEPAKDLFEFAFSLLTGLGVRDRHYQAIHDAIRYHVCPFCGLEYFDAPGAPREDLDHYLASSHYPFAAVSLRNLSPMGMKCNERYKLATDILRDEDGNRRRSFYPYADREVHVSLMNSVPFDGADRQAPAWQIDFAPDSPECATWDAVFRLRERIQRDVLDRSYRRWLSEFATWFVKRKGTADLSDERLIESLHEHAENMAFQGFNAKEFLRTHVFEMLHQHCFRGNRRMLDFVRDLVTQAVLQPAAAA